jgi:hypothetical protein
MSATFAPPSRTARTRLDQQLADLFAADTGLGDLAAGSQRPGMTEQTKTRQTAWAKALVGLHGRERAAAAYAHYARSRQHDIVRAAQTLTSWDDLVLGTGTLDPWPRDRHGFLCSSCNDWYPMALVDGFPTCTHCARDIDARAAYPLWKAHAHHEFVFPDLLPEEYTNGEASIAIQYRRDGEVRYYTMGDAALLLHDGALPGRTVERSTVDGPDRDTISGHITATTRHSGQHLTITADFIYDPRPEPGEPHPYGFRLTRAALTPAGNQGTSTHTDVDHLLAAILDTLYDTDQH